MIIINFKNYKRGKELEKTIKSLIKTQAILALPSIYLKTYVQKNVIAQSIDNTKERKSTGKTGIKELKTIRITGALLNHSENKKSFNEIKEIVKEAHGFKIILCASTIKEVKKFKKLKPYAIAFEDPKLIATKKSITRSPERIKDFVKLLKETKIIPLCGAGVTSNADYKKAQELGCKGVLMSSAILKAKNPKKALEKILS